MPSETVRDLYVAELTDLYDAEQQALRELPLLAASATSSALRDVFDEHYRQTQRHVERLETLFRQLEERPRGDGCRALRAIIEDGRLRNSKLDRGAALDAALIALAQRIEHFEIGGYRSARTHAERLLDRTGAEMLQLTLTEEDGMEERLVALARLSSTPLGVDRAAPLSANPAAALGARLSTVPAIESGASPAAPLGAGPPTPRPATVPEAS